MQTIKSALRRVLVGGVLVASFAGLTGCDELGGLGGWDSGYGDYYGSDTGGGYGPIDDDVFQNAANAWSDYIRS